MQTYYNILDTIRRQLLQDKFVNTVTNGDIFDVDLEKKTIYPLSHVMVNQATRKDKVYTLNMTVLLMDIVDKVSHEAQDVFKGNDNEQDVFNTQLAVGARLVEVLKRGDLRDNNFELSSDPNFEPFTERFENSLAGWALTFDVDMPNDMTICDADIVPSDCAAANYSITDEDGNVLYSGTIESGLSLTQSITNSDVQNSDGSYSVGVPAQGNLTLPDETILVVNTNMDIIASDTNRPSVKDGTIEVPNVDNIDSDGSTVSTPAGVPFTCTPVVPCPPVVSSAKLLKTGQTVSYFSKDDGDLQKGREVDFFTLPENNPFGNTDRFTDTLGGQTYTNDIVIDWSTYDGNTVLAYYRVMGGVDNWEDSVLNASSLSIGGFTSGWRLTNAVEFNNLHLFGNGRPMTWTPLNQPNLNLRYWTSTTLNNYTNQPYYGSNFFGSGGVTGTQSYNWLSCRDFTLTELGL